MSQGKDFDSQHTTKTEFAQQLKTKVVSQTLLAVYNWLDVVEVRFRPGSGMSFN